MIYTSYFGILNKIKKKGDIVVGICRRPPKNIANIDYLAPSEELMTYYKSGKNTFQNDFEKLYRAEVRDYIDKFIKTISCFQNTDSINIFLCCYEKSNDFCHRHILRKILQEHGVKIEEYKL